LVSATEVARRRQESRRTFNAINEIINKFH
jgi:hypothetical protein